MLRPLKDLWEIPVEVRTPYEAVYPIPAVEYNGAMHKLRIPAPNPRTRLLAVVCGLLIFLWFTPEDNQVWPVTILGILLSLVVVGLTIIRRLGGTTIPARYVLPGALLVGALTGLGASLSIAGLMFFKNALHAHLFLDYPPGMMLAMLGRAPGWTLAGALVGLGTAFAWLAVERK